MWVSAISFALLIDCCNPFPMGPDQPNLRPDTSSRRSAEIAQPQPLPDPPSAGSIRLDGAAAPILPVKTGTGRGDPAGGDSLELAALDLEIEQARIEVERTEFFYRCFPRVTISASFGYGGLLFADPDGTLPAGTGRENYRVLMSLPLSDILDSSRHGRAELRLRALLLERDRTLRRLRGEQEDRARTLRAARRELEILSEEEELASLLVRFQQIRFEQGKIQFDDLIRSRLQLLSARRRLEEASEKIPEIR